MKVALILPRSHLDHDLLFRPRPIVHAVQQFFKPVLPRSLRGRTKILMPPLGLLKLAAVTPQDVEVRIIDERFQSIDSVDDTDLIGITAVTKAVTRAYEIATQLRAKGAKVVLGGPHATFMAEEALRYVDAVALGEGESVWPEIIEDARSGHLKRVYSATNLIRSEDIPPPRLDLIEKDNYAPLCMLETTRGCPNDCVYCTVQSMWGRSYRKRPIEQVLEELSNHESRLVWFSSDNLSVDRQYARELFRALVPLKIHWAAFCTVDAAMDTEYLDLAVASGCQAFLLGFETLSSNSLVEIHKQSTNKLPDYKESIRNLHDRGILVAGSFLFGFDHDTPLAFEEVTDFIETNRIECPNLNIVIPYPGTELYDQLEHEKRLLHKDWRYYDTGASYVVFQPANMLPHELRDLHLEAKGRILGGRSILRRIGHLRSPLHILLALQFNLGMRYIHQRNCEERIDPKTQRHY